MSFSVTYICNFIKKTSHLIFIAIIFLCLTVADIYAADNSKENKIKVGYFDFYGFNNTNPSGTKSGYNIEYLQRIAMYTGWEYEYIKGSWDECLQMLADGEIDLLGLVQKTDERLELYDYAYIDSGTLYGGLYVLQDRDIAYEDFNAFNGLKVGMLKGSTHNEYFLEYQRLNDFSMNSFIYENEYELNNALKERKIDAITTTSIRKTEGEKMVARFKPAPFYYATTKGNTSVLNNLNTAISEIKLSNPYFDLNLYDKYYSNDKAKSEELSSQEIEFIKNNKKITAVYDPQWYPIEYYDEKTETFSGTTSSIFKLIEKYSGLEFDFLKTDSYEESYQMVADGKANLICGTMSKFTTDMQLTNPYYNTPLVMVGRKGTSINKDTIIAMPENYKGPSEIVKKLYPKLTIKTYETIDECLKEVRKKSSNMVTVENSYVINNLLLTAKYDQLEIISVTENTYGMYIGVSNNANPILLSILNKSIAHISENEKNAIMFSHTTDIQYKLPLYMVVRQYSFLIIIVLTIFFIIIIAIILYNRKRKESALKIAAYTDILTEGKNLLKFKLDVKELLTNRDDDRFALVYFDIDKFKYINDIYGYDEGNKTLICISNVINKNMETHEISARVSADSFTILLKYVSDEYLLYRLQRILDEIVSFENINTKHYDLVFSSGIYVIKSGDTDINSILDKANVARKTVKGSSKNSYAFYTNEINDRIIEEKEIENIMKKSLVNEEFKIYMQPKYNLFGNKILGAEALVRWQHPQRGLIYPDDFIFLFEKNGFIVNLDCYVFEMVCQKIRYWIDQDYIPIVVSVNVSRIDLHNKDFVDNCKSLIEKYNIPAEFIELELTESVMYDNIDEVLDIMKKLKDIGFLLSIDDFGSGYSSLNMLKDMPIDVLKLDRKFMVGTIGSERGKTIVSKIVEMAKAIKIKVVSEGIETQEQVDFLKTTKCDMVQGFLFSKPIPMDNMDKLMNKKINQKEEV